MADLTNERVSVGGIAPGVFGATLISNISATTTAVSVSALDVARIVDISIATNGITGGSVVRVEGCVDNGNNYHTVLEITSDGITQIQKALRKIRATIPIYGGGTILSTLIAKTY